LPESLLTAKTLRARDVFFDPHSGHATGESSLIDFTSFSNFASQLLQAYSYIGTALLLVTSGKQDILRARWQPAI